MSLFESLEFEHRRVYLAVVVTLCVSVYYFGAVFLFLENSGMRPVYEMGK